MKKVEQYSNWGYFDQLDGTNLVNGEKIKVKWPNGQTSTEKVVIKSYTETISDMGSPCEIPYQHAFVEVAFKGVKALVRLYGQNVLCERVR